MRVALICGQKQDSLQRFREQLGQSQIDLHWIGFPKDDPRVIAAIGKGHHPTVQWSQAPDGSFLILDGEVFSFADRHDHSVQCLPTASPNHAARLLSLFQQTGPEVFEKIDASACVILWDAATSQLTVYRDRYGMVPGYYSQQNGFALWASDMGSLMPFIEDRSINLAAMDFLLKDGFIPAPWTFAQSVSKLRPGHCLTIDTQGQTNERRYWLPTPVSPTPLAGQEVLEELGAHLTQSVARRADPARRLGIMLSGGVDSKLLAATLRLKLDRDFDSFTFHYEDHDGSYNENDEARRAADFLGANHHEVSFGPRQIADQFSDLLRAYGEPFTSGLHTAMLGPVAACGVTDLFNGAGADGWYIGKRNHLGMRARALPSPLRRMANLALPIARLVNPRKAAAAASVLHWAPEAYHNHFHLSLTSLPFRRQLYADPSWLAHAHERRDQLFFEAAEDYRDHNLREKLILLHAQFYLADHVFYWNHCWSRAHNLAARSPYFDADLMDFVFQMPRNNVKKEELRELATTLMPRDMAYTSKFPQSLPIGPWFRGPLKDFLREKLSPKRISNSGLFDNKTLQPLITRHINGAQGSGMALWAILAIIEWQDLVAKDQLAKNFTLASPPVTQSIPAA